MSSLSVTIVDHSRTYVHELLTRACKPETEGEVAITAGVESLTTGGAFLRNYLSDVQHLH